MIIQCEKCSTKFRLDDSRITGNGVKVRCTKCQNVFIVTPPPPVEEVQVEEIFTPGTPEAKQEGEKPKAQKDRPDGSANLKFNFEAGPDKKGETARSDVKELKETPVDKIAAPAPAPGLTFNNIDFSFGVDRTAPGAGADGNGKPLAADAAIPPSAQKNPPTAPDFDFVPARHDLHGEEKSGEIDFTFDDEKPDTEEGLTGPAATDAVEAGGDEKIKAAPDKGPSAPENVIPFTAGYTREGRPAPVVEKTGPSLSDASPEPSGALEGPAQSGQPEDKKEFSDLLLDSISKKTGDMEEGLKHEEPGPGHQTRSYGLFIVLFVLIIGGGAVYFSGVIDAIARRLAPPPHAVVKKTIEIENINGFYAENKNFGRFFILQAKIRNISDVPQEIKRVTGVLYNATGQKIATRSVSPGRIVSQDDVKNLSKEDLLKPFKDPSGGSIPAKGTVPVMVPFTEVPQGLTEYGLDIVR